MIKKIGIFGGSFDPVHLGHKLLAEFMVKTLELDKLLIIPAACSPFKDKTSASSEARFEMCKLQFPEEIFDVSDIEVLRGSKSYTVDTVNAVKEKYPESEIFLIIGSDQLVQFHKWFHFDEIMKNAVVCAVARDGKDSVDFLEKCADENLRMFGKCKILKFSPLEISSTQIREKIRSGEKTKGLLSEKVSQFIKNEGLYQVNTVNKDILIKDIREHLSDFRYTHSLCVAESCVKLAEKYGEDQEKAYLAGIMHDVLKELPEDEMFAFFASHNTELSKLERNTPKLWHAMAGAVYLKEKYGFSDDIVSAVRFHTTGKENMSTLEKILFVADFISADRDYPGVDEMRKRAEISLEYAMEEGLRFTINELSEKCFAIHPDTISCYNEIVLRNI